LERFDGELWTPHRPYLSGRSCPLCELLYIRVILTDIGFQRRSYCVRRAPHFDRGRRILSAHDHSRGRWRALHLAKIALDFFFFIPDYLLARMAVRWRPGLLTGLVAKDVNHHVRPLGSNISDHALAEETSGVSAALAHTMTRLS
jgi:hypothetical protein